MNEEKELNKPAEKTGAATGTDTAANTSQPQRAAHAPRPRFNRYEPVNEREHRSYGERSNYRPRFNREEGGGYEERRYQPRQGYERHSYANEGGYQRRPYQQREGYAPGRRGGDYQPQREGSGYRPAGAEGNYPRRENAYPRREGGYQHREGGYPRREGGYRPQGQGYAPYEGAPRYAGGERGNYRPQRGGYRPQNAGYGRPYAGAQRPRTNGGYNPNAKYSQKKRIEYKEENFDPEAPIRLNKYLANAGVCSRRDADKYIEAGVVTVNGNVVTELGTKIKRSDEVKFHDQPVTMEKKVYVLLNKPKDCVTTSDDPQNRKTVMQLVRGACPERIYPVGRLDRNTTGVLLLTNDGDLASKLTHPKFLKKKIYHVYLDKNLKPGDMQQILDGVKLDDGEIRADAIEYTNESDKKQVGIEIHSGKNRIVRRIFESLGYRVIKLDRVYFAGLTKKNVRRGDWRYLTEAEVNMLRMGAFE